MEKNQKLGSSLYLWGFYPEVGKYLPFWHPDGAIIRNSIEDFWKREHFKQGYDLVYTPHIATSNIWDVSEHTKRYAGKMYPRIVVEPGKEEYILRPMNCPFHILLFKSEPHTYKDLPIRYAELGTVYRKIPSGSFKEMFEVRCFTQDDAHIFCDPQDARKEIANLINFTIFFLRDIFKIDDYRIIRRLKPNDAIGDDAMWDSAQKILQDVLEEKDLDYDNGPGEGIFYGPKIDFEVTDPHYRKGWICSTIQLDTVLAKKFKIQYKTKNNRVETPLIIHRTILGSLERFIAILVARTKGYLPLWISPCQLLLIPIGGVEFQSNLSYARNVKAILENKIADLNPRIKIDCEDRDIRMAKSKALEKKIPYIVMIGPRERINERLSVVCCDGKESPSEIRDILIDELANELRDKIQNKT